jgi:hypothetical protein
MPEAKPILPPNPLRDAYALVQGMSIEAQLREVVDQLGYPELIAAELRRAFQAVRVWAEGVDLPPVEPADLEAVDLEEMAREHFYATREIAVAGAPPFTCLASRFDALGEIAGLEKPRATLDYVGVTADSARTPVLGVVQHDADSSAYPLLLRGLACLAELASYSQLERLSKRLFGGALGAKPSFDLELVLWDPSGREEASPLEQLTRDLSEKIKAVIRSDTEYPRILRDVVCLRMDASRFDGRLRFAWRV